MLMLVDFHKALLSPVSVTVETRRYSFTVQPSQSLNNPEFSASPSITKICFNRSGIEMKFCLASLAAVEEQECRRVKKKMTRCARVSKIIELYLLILHVCFSSLVLNTALTLSVGLYPLLSLLWLSFCHCTFFSCLPSPRAVSPSPLPPLPSHFSLSL